MSASTCGCGVSSAAGAASSASRGGSCTSAFCSGSVAVAGAGTSISAACCASSSVVSETCSTISWVSTASASGSGVVIATVDSASGAACDSELFSEISLAPLTSEVGSAGAGAMALSAGPSAVLSTADSMTSTIASSLCLLSSLAATTERACACSVDASSAISTSCA